MIRYSVVAKLYTQRISFNFPIQKKGVKISEQFIILSPKIITLYITNNITQSYILGKNLIFKLPQKIIDNFFFYI